MGNTFKNNFMVRLSIVFSSIFSLYIDILLSFGYYQISS